MDRETLHRILTNPTRVGLDKVEKEVARINGINDVLRKELQTWKDAVTARNETIVDLNNTITKLRDCTRTLEEDRKIVNRRIKKNQKKDALQVEELRIELQATYVAANQIARNFTKLTTTLETTEIVAEHVRDSIAGNVEIDWTKELNRESDDTDTE